MFAYGELGTTLFGHYVYVGLRFREMPLVLSDRDKHVNNTFVHVWMGNKDLAKGIIVFPSEFNMVYISPIWR